MKIFDLYGTEDVKIEDFGLKRYINLDIKLVLKSRGRYRERFGKAKVNIVERLINIVAVPGHRGKKHKIMTKSCGKYTKGANIVLGAFKIIEERTKENPIQVLVRAVEKAAPRDEITTIEYGGARYPQATDSAPLRRLNVALKHIVHGAYDKAFAKKKKIPETLANEIILASKGTNESFAITKKIETEKQADSAR
ncbi:MAG: 30S ribosomal protein S7 [Candidatus Pacearchaeota archaeon]|nr:MAG: 30S ribosomal protein S7 [Candidatus Pacearchaeota archaeon]